MKRILAFFLLLSVLASLVSCKLPRIQFVYDDEPEKDDAVNDDVVNDDVVNDEQDNNSNTPNEDIYIPTAGISLNKERITGHIGDTFSLTATVSPDNATDKSVVWHSNNPSVAQVTQTGEVMLKGIGTTKIYAKSAEGYKAYCNITVEKNLEYFEMQLTRENWSDFLKVTVYESQNSIVIVIDPLYDDITYKNVSFDFEFTIMRMYEDSYNFTTVKKNLNCGIGINNVYLYGYTHYWNYSKSFVSGVVSGYIEK
jgi:hypothetical protein